jgi:hypothetical protein
LHLDQEGHPVIQEPTQLTPTPQAKAATLNSAARLGLIIAAVLLLAIPVVMAMAANSPSQTPSNVLAAGASAAPTPDETGEPGDVDGNNGQGKVKDKGPKFGRGPGAFGLGGPGNSGKVNGAVTIRSISGNNLTLGTDDGWTRTIAVTTDTVITKGGVTVAVGALSVGDQIGFRQTRNADGTYTITAITVPTPRAGGEVTAIDGNDVTVKGKGGTTRVITVTGSTVYKLGDAAGSKADIKVGGSIQAQGTVSGTTFTATAVDIELPELGGVVTGKTSDTITVKDRAGTSRTIHVTGSTTYERKDVASAKLSDIAIGDNVDAEGTLRADGSIDAVSVHSGAPKVHKPPKAPAPGSSAVPG